MIFGLWFAPFVYLRQALLANFCLSAESFWELEAN